MTLLVHGVGVVVVVVIVVVAVMMKVPGDAGY